MRNISSKVGIPLVMAIVLLLILAFPGSLYATDLSLAHQTRVPAHSHQVPAVSVTHYWVRNRAHREPHNGLLMDADVRMRAAVAIMGSPAIEKAIERAGVPLRIIVITASPLLEV